jgi:hypothetical protein
LADPSSFCEKASAREKNSRSLRLTTGERQKLIAYDYVQEHRSLKWARELRPWQQLLQRELNSPPRTGNESSTVN